MSSRPKQVGMLITPTKEECVAAAVKEGMPPREGEKLFVHYTLAGWKYGKGKVPIANLAVVVAGWKLRWEEKGCPDTNGHQASPDPNSGVILMARSKEYDRVIKEIDVLKSWRDAQGLNPDQKQKWTALINRKNELKKLLGIQY